jgi:hypothetical protein
MRVLPWSNTLLAWQVGINFSPLVNQPVVLLVNVREYGREEDSKAWAQFVTERSPSMYIRMRVLPGVTLC